MEIIRREDGLNDLFGWLSCTSVWLNEDKLGFSMDRDADFFPQETARLSNACEEAYASKRPRPFPLSSASKH